MSKDEEKTPATLEMLNKHLSEVKQFQPDSTPKASLPGDAARPAIDFASATAVGIVLGYGLDAWQGTSPWGLLGGLFLGTAAGVKLLLHGPRKRKGSVINETKH